MNGTRAESEKEAALPGAADLRAWWGRVAPQAKTLAQNLGTVENAKAVGGAVLQPSAQAHATVKNVLQPHVPRVVDTIEKAQRFGVLGPNSLAPGKYLGTQSAVDLTNALHEKGPLRAYYDRVIRVRRPQTLAQVPAWSARHALGAGQAFARADNRLNAAMPGGILGSAALQTMQGVGAETLGHLLGHGPGGANMLSYLRGAATATLPGNWSPGATLKDHATNLVSNQMAHALKLSEEKKGSEIPLPRIGHAAAIAAGVATPLVGMYGLTQLMGHGVPWLVNKMQGAPPPDAGNKLGAWRDRVESFVDKRPYAAAAIGAAGLGAASVPLALTANAYARTANRIRSENLPLSEGTRVFYEELTGKKPTQSVAQTGVTKVAAYSARMREKVAVTLPQALGLSLLGGTILGSVGMGLRHAFTPDAVQAPAPEKKETWSSIGVTPQQHAALAAYHQTVSPHSTWLTDSMDAEYMVPAHAAAQELYKHFEPHPWTHEGSKPTVHNLVKQIVTAAPHPDRWADAQNTYSNDDHHDNLTMLSEIAEQAHHTPYS